MQILHMKQSRNDDAAQVAAVSMHACLSGLLIDPAAFDLAKLLSKWQLFVFFSWSLRWWNHALVSDVVTNKDCSLRSTHDVMLRVVSGGMAINFINTISVPKYKYLLTSADYV